MTAFQIQIEPSINKQTTATGELCSAELDAVNGGSVRLVTNLANMRHEMLKSIANNLRG